ncbi:hypothetical protein Trydic_g8004 [Trypoxylus dichotomus]
MVSVDLEKEFDKIRHVGLLLKMRDCGFHARILKTVRTYLQIRSCHTAVNDCGSTERRTTSLYFRDIPRYKDHRVFHAIYADDTAVVITPRRSKIAADLAQAHLAKIKEFFCTWGLKINSRNTQAIALTRTHQELQQKIIVSKDEGNRQLYPLLSNPALNPKIGIMLHKLHIRSILTYAPHGSRQHPATSHPFAICGSIVHLKKTHKKKSQEVHGRLPGPKKTPGCPQQVPGRKILEEDGAKKGVQPTNNRTQSKAAESRAFGDA